MLEKTKGLQSLNCKPLFYMVCPKRFELLTPWFVGRAYKFKIYINQQLTESAVLKCSRI